MGFECGDLSKVKRGGWHGDMRRLASTRCVVTLYMGGFGQRVLWRHHNTTAFATLLASEVRPLRYSTVSSMRDLERSSTTIC